MKRGPGGRNLTGFTVTCQRFRAAGTGLGVRGRAKKRGRTCCAPGPYTVHRVEDGPPVLKLFNLLELETRDSAACSVDRPCAPHRRTNWFVSSPLLEISSSRYASRLVDSSAESASHVVAPLRLGRPTYSSADRPSSSQVVRQLLPVLNLVMSKSFVPPKRRDEIPKWGVVVLPRRLRHRGGFPRRFWKLFSGGPVFRVMAETARQAFSWTLKAP